MPGPEKQLVITYKCQSLKEKEMETLKLPGHPETALFACCLLCHPLSPTAPLAAPGSCSRSSSHLPKALQYAVGYLGIQGCRMDLYGATQSCQELWGAGVDTATRRGDREKPASSLSSSALVRRMPSDRGKGLQKEPAEAGGHPPQNPKSRQGADCEGLQVSCRECQGHEG